MGIWNDREAAVVVLLLDPTVTADSVYPKNEFGPGTTWLNQNSHLPNSQKNPTYIIIIIIDIRRNERYSRVNKSILSAVNHSVISRNTV